MPSVAFQLVGGYCMLLSFKPADNACPSLLMMPILGSPVCGWLQCLAVLQAC